VTCTGEIPPRSTRWNDGLIDLGPTGSHVVLDESVMRTTAGRLRAPFLGDNSSQYATRRLNHTRSERVILLSRLLAFASSENEVEHTHFG